MTDKAYEAMTIFEIVNNFFRSESPVNIGIKRDNPPFTSNFLLISLEFTNN